MEIKGSGTIGGNNFKLESKYHMSWGIPTLRVRKHVYMYHEVRDVAVNTAHTAGFRVSG
jgi:hypothetical protein